MHAAARAGRWNVVSNTLTAQLVHALPSERAALSLRLGEAWEKLGEADRASVAYREAVEAGALGAAAQRAFARQYAIALRANRVDRAVEIAHLASEHSGIARGAQADWLATGAGLLRGLSRSAEVAAWLRRALARDPARIAVLDALELHCRDSAAWGDYADVLKRKAAVLARRPTEAIAVLTRLAALQKDVLGLPEAAGDTYLRILELNPRHEAAQRYLASQRFRPSDAQER